MKTIAKLAAVALFAIAATGCKQTPKLALTDGEWAMVSWQNDAGEQQMVVTNRPTMKFDTESKVSGNAGCNNFSGTYVVEKDLITVNMGAMTRKMCLDVTLENRMTAQMPNVAAFKIDGNLLILSDKDGKEIFRFDNTAVAAGQNQ